MNLLSFIQIFPQETDCLEYFRAVREKLGLMCNHCGCTDHTWHQGKSQFQCNNCGCYKNIYEETILENSELPIKYWFIAIHLLTSTHGHIDTEAIQKQFGETNETAVLRMFNKLQSLMKKVDYRFDFEELLIACVTNEQKIRTKAG